MAKDKPKPGIPTSRKSVRVQTTLDAELYVRFCAGAALSGHSHSRFMTLAIEAQLREMGIVVVRRRSAGQVAPSDEVDRMEEVA